MTNEKTTDSAASALSAGLGALPTMADAMAAGDGVLLNEQAALLRECRRALDDLLRQKPMMACMLCGSNSLGNLRAELYAYRPQGVFNGQAPNAKVSDAGTASAEVLGRANALEAELKATQARLVASDELLQDALATLRDIGDFAHDRSTGPAVEDALWEVRRMAYELL